MDNNPLKQYFRQPAIYIRLPSDGKFYPPGALIMSPNGEYPVLPMTTVDEITYRTPDALFNGSAVPTVIESCMPNIKDAWNMPSMDIDTVLTAIRIATYGHEMGISTKCPNCSNEDEYSVDLRNVMENIGRPNYTQSLRLGDLELIFRPMSYRQINENSMIQFEEQKTLQMLADGEGDEKERMAQMGEMLKKITAVTSRALAENIALVVTPTAQVDQQEHITEWLMNCDRTMFGKIRDHIIGIKEQAELKPLAIKCSNCSHDYQQPFTLDMSNFFAAAS
jgi:hypothetical protein